MGSRGRKSGAELTLVARAEDVLGARRPDPPDHLSDEAAVEWREIVNSLPADHFSRATHPMLEAYCRHAVATRVIDRLIQELDEREGATLSDYDRLLVMHERESRALASIGVRLGIACASRLQNAKPISCVTNKPWEKLPR
jgi:phage terminase small subunit